MMTSISSTKFFSPKNLVHISIPMNPQEWLKTYEFNKDAEVL